jgi:peptide/nickel transport system substrate-binding protein
VNRFRPAFLFLLLLLCLGCRDERATAPAAARTVDDNKPQDGGTVVRRLESDISTFNPILITTGYDHYVNFYLFEPLVQFNAALEPVPGLAEKWEVSADGKDYTFHLAPKAKFSDGTPVRAADVLFSLKKIIDPASEAVQIAGWFDQLDIKRTRIVDDRTIIIAFKEALATQLVWFYGLRVIPEHVYANKDFKTAFDSVVVGTGPYRVVRRIPGQEIVLERRPDYWGPFKPYLQTIIFKVIVDNTTAWNAVKRGDIDESTIKADVWNNESGRPELKKYIDFRRFYTLNYNYLPWNGHDPLFADKRVRRALAQCLDLESIVKNLYHGTARAMNGPFTPDQWAYNPDVPVIQYNPQEAKRMLNSLGWLDTDGDGLLDKNHKPFRFEMLVPAESNISAQTAQLFQSELKNIGIDMKVTPLDGNAFMGRVLGGNFQAATLSWELDPDPDQYTIFHSSQTPPHGYNFVFYSNPVADKLIEAGHRELDHRKRVVIYRQLHAVLADDQPYTWTVQVSVKWAINKRLRDVRESKGWGLLNWTPGPLTWWIPRDQRTHDRR